MTISPSRLPGNSASAQAKPAGRPRTPAATPSGRRGRLKRISPTKSLTKVLLVHRSPVTRFGLKALLDSLGSFRICGQTDDAPQVHELVARHQPDVIVLGLTLRHGDGIGLLKDFRKSSAAVPALVLSDRTDPLSVQRAFRAGARGYLVAHDDISEIPRAIMHILSGEFYASPSVARLLLQVLAKGGTLPVTAELSQLSDRELQIFGMIGRGFGASRVAKELHLSVKTIETHRMRMKQKLGLRTGADLNRHAEDWLAGEMRRRDRAGLGRSLPGRLSGKASAPAP